jgi:hypothetical protein
MRKIEKAREEKKEKWRTEERRSIDRKGKWLKMDNGTGKDRDRNR